MTFVERHYHTYQDRRPVTAGLSDFVAGMIRALSDQREKRRAIAHLQGLSHQQLDDIGFDRSTIAYAVNGSRK